MSIELRITTEGDCTCGVPYPTDDPPPDHAHHIECDWGRIEHPDPRPGRNEIGHLIIAAADAVTKDLANGPDYHYRATDDDGRHLWQEYSATTHGERTFLHTAYPIYDQGDRIRQPDGSELPPTAAQRWTWELFPAHWWDQRPSNILIGRWPD